MTDINYNLGGLNIPHHIQRGCVECKDLCDLYFQSFRWTDGGFSVEYAPQYSKKKDFVQKPLCKKCYRTNKLTR